MAIGTAFKAFFVTLFNSEKSQLVEAVLSGIALSAPEKTESTESDEPTVDQKPKKVEPSKPKQSEAITLLAALQREARFIDFIQEPLDGYQDAQVGAAAREVHRDCGRVIRRLLDIQPLLTDDEMAQVEVPDGFDPGRYHLTGSVSGDAPFRGSLVHHGWIASKCELPAWSGSDESARVVGPAEVEVK